MPWLLLLLLLFYDYLGILPDLTNIWSRVTQVKGIEYKTLKGNPSLLCHRANTLMGITLLTLFVVILVQQIWIWVDQPLGPTILDGQVVNMSAIINARRFLRI